MKNAAPPLPPGAALRWSVVRPVVKEFHPADILEVGCGGGGFGARLVTMTHRYTAVEPDETSWEAAHARISPLGGVVLRGDHTALPPGAQFDLVCAFEVLEHLADDSAAAAAWTALVRPGGHLLVSVPACPARMGAWDQLVGHYRRYSGAQAARLLREAGCVDVRVRHYGWPIGYVLETVRNTVATRRKDATFGSVQERTASSGRQLQPKRSAVGAAVRVGTAPFAVLQELAPRRGVALLAMGRVPG